jgi:hypothetical protein
MKTIQFKTNFDPEDYKRIEKAILKYMINTFSGHIGNKYFRTWRQLDDIIGTAYTSTGIYAIYGVCNGNNIYLDASENLRLEMFCIDTENNIYAEYWDESEQAFYFKIN